MAALNHRQVEAFRAVMLTGGVTTAAQLMNVTQPAVSRLIRDLQETLKLRLFERRGTRLLPTGEALSLYQEVEQSFVGLDRITRAATDLRGRRAGVLRIASYPALATTFLPRFVARFLADRPRLDIAIYGVSSRIVLEWVASGQCDIGFASDALEFPAVKAEMMQNADAVAVLAPGHPLAGRPYLQPKDFRGERFISLGQFTLLRHRIDFAFSAARTQRHVHVEANLTEIACGMVAAGLGVSIVDPLMAEEFRDRGLVIRPFRPRIPIEFAALHSEQRVLSGVAQEFIAQFQRDLADIVGRQAPAEG
jgi:DNA-binding transcriptional LysR family regulator